MQFILEIILPSFIMLLTIFFTVGAVLQYLKKDYELMMYCVAPAITCAVTYHLHQSMILKVYSSI